MKYPNELLPICKVIQTKVRPELTLAPSSPIGFPEMLRVFREMFD